jgi:hypothetical protein
MKARGFTVLEVLTATTLAIITMTCSMAAAVSIYRRFVSFANATAAADEAARLSEVLMVQLEQVGGGGVRPWNAVVVDDNAGASCAALAIGAVSAPACGGSDRVHLLSLETSIPQCSITAFDGTTVKAGTASSCCLTAAHQTDLVLAAANGAWRARRCVGFTAATCGCTLMPTAAGYERLPATAPTAFVGGVLAVGVPESYFVDATGVLHGAMDANGDGIVEDLRLAERVADLQLELGLDADGDGTPEVFAPTYGANDPTTLRSLRVGVLVRGLSHQKSSARLFNGPLRTATTPSVFKRAVRSAPMRNVGIFQ